MVIASAMETVIGWTYFSEASLGSRREGPFSTSLWAVWISRSQIASAWVGSAMYSWKRLGGTWLLMIVERLPWRSSRTSKRSRRSASVIGVIAKSSITRTSARAILARRRAYVP